MIVKLTRAARIPHEAGEIVEVSPDFAHILFSQGAAVGMTDGEKDEMPGETDGVAETDGAAEMPTTKPKTRKKG